MASTYSPNLRIELIGTGDQAGTWGNTTNSTDQYVLESAITGYQQVTVTSTSQALTYVNGATTTASSNQAIFAFLSLVTSGVSAPFNIYAPPNPKSYVVYNNSSYAATIYNSTAIGNTIAAGLGVTIPAGATITIWSDGTNVQSTNTQTTGNFTVNGNLTVTGNQTEIGNFYAAGVFRAFTSASFTGSISGTTLTVTTVASGVLFQGMSISGTGIAAATSTNLTDPLSTTSGSSTVTVTQTAHGFSSGTPVTISGAAAVGGISAANLNGTFTITVINSSSYSYTASASATSTVTLSGGAVIVSTPQTQISGYITGAGGLGTYTVNVPQSAASTTITGAPAATASTPPTTDNSNNVATTAFVKNVAAQAGSFTYPSAGIANSTGASWGTSFNNTTNPIPVSFGGTGLATLTSGAVLVGNGTSAPTAISPSFANNVLASNGSVWSSTPFSTLLGTSAVTSFNGRTGPVTPSSTDYSSYYYPLSSNPSNYVTSSALSGYAQLNSTNNFTGANNYSSTASITATGTSAGNQRIGVTYSTYSSGLSATSLQLAGNGIGVLFDTTTNTFGFLNGFGGGSGTYLSITPISGAIGLSNNTLYTSAVDAIKGGSSTAWIATSDIRLKNNIQDYTKGLDLLNQIKPRTWVYNGKGGSTQGAEGLGVVADEIEQVLPSVIRTIPGKLNPEDTEKTDIKHVDTTEITWLLVNAVKELSAKVTALEEQILNLGVK